MPAFQTGWNTFGYPVAGTRPVAKALASIEDSYTSVYHYDSNQPESWTMYDKTVMQEQPALVDFVNDLTQLEFGHAYWISITQPVTLYLGVVDGYQSLNNNLCLTFGKQTKTAGQSIGHIKPFSSHRSSPQPRLNGRYSRRIC